MEKESQKKKQVTKEVKAQIVTSIIAALGLVVGLAWNDAIKGLIESVFPLESNTVLAQFGYAIAITVLVVVVSIYIIKPLKEEQEDKNN